VNAELRIVMFFVEPVIVPPRTVRPSIVMLLAPAKLIDMLAVAPACSVMVTMPDLLAPLKEP
jgi:hypothetical protein